MSKNVMKKRDVDGSDLSPTSKNVATTVAIGVQRSFSGSAAVAAGQSIRRPPGPARGEPRGN